MRKSLPLLIFTGALAGCMLGPDYLRPTIDAPKAFRFEDKTASDLANTVWWEQFKDPVLNDLIRIALAENKDVKIAAARVEEYLGKYGVSRSQLFPQVGADFNGSRNRASQAAVPAPLPGSVDPQYTNIQATLYASWEIDVWGKIRRLNEAARADLLATEEGRRATILTLVASVASAYVNLRDLDQQLDIARATAASRGESVKVFEQRFKGGVVSEMELAQNVSEYELALASIPQIQIQVAQQESALSVLLGRNPGPITRGRAIGKFDAPAVPAGLPSELLERRPDLRQAEQNLIAANARIGAAKALYFPTISLTALFGGVSTQLSSLFSGANKVWSYGGDATMPIFTAGRTAGYVQQAEALQQQALLQYEKSIQTAFKEVEDSLVSLQKSREQVASQGRQVDALRTYARMARLRYENGYTSYLEVVDAETRLFNAELSYTQTQGNVFVSLVSLYKAMGGGWVVDAERLTSAEPAGKGMAEAK
jgi:multidrug efflux system outer membrane protein